MKYKSNFKPLFILLFLFFSIVLSKPALALYDVNNTGDSDIYGLSGNDVRPAIGSDFGTVRAIADTNNAYALFGDDGNVEISGDFPEDGIIYAEAGNNGAYGLFADGNGVITTGNINGFISAAAENNYAYGFSAYSSITTGNINGDIDVTAGANSAYGLSSSNGSITTGDIGGNIYVRSGTYGAYGIFSSGGDVTTGDIEGIIYARSDTNDAFGIYSYSGSVTTGDIKGDVAAYAAGKYAYGILSYGPIDTKIDGGYIYGYASSDSNYAAIQSGRIESGVLTSQNADDNVEIAAGSSIVGDIDLAMNGTDNDILTLSGVDTNSTTLNYDLKNIETINLTGGTWRLNGSVINNTNGIEMTGGILSGTGTLGSLNVTGGTLSPGNNIGTTTIDGDLTLGSDSTLKIEVDNSGHSDKLIVTGDAFINGGTLKTASNVTISSTHDYTIIEANTISGEFGVVDTALLRTILSEVIVDVNYLADRIVLTVIPERFDSSELFTTSNQRSVGLALQQIADSGGNGVTTALQQLATPGQVRDSYNQLSGQTRISLASVSEMGNTRFNDIVFNRLHNTQSVYSLKSGNTPLFAMAKPDNGANLYDTDTSMNSFAIGNGTEYFASEHWGFWGRGYGVFGDRENQDEMPGYQYRVYGTGYGLDFKVSDELLIGVTGGYSYGRVDYFSSRDKSDIYSTPLGLYGSWFTKNGYIDSIVNYAQIEYETQRYVDLTSETLKGDFDGYDAGASIEAGRNWFVGKDFLVQPLASFQFSYLNLEDYRESGGVSALSFDDQSYKSYKGSLGMRVKKQFGKEPEEQSSVVELRGRWLHEFGDTKSDINANFADSPNAIFTITDEGLPRDSAVLGLGFRHIVQLNSMYYIDYDTSLNTEDTSHIVSAGLRYRW